MLLDLLSAIFRIKNSAREDLHELANEEESYIRFRTAYAIGSAFEHVPVRQKAWNELIILSEDEDRHVRAYANHSLGKVSIFKAIKVENEIGYKNEFEKAIEFFDKSLHEHILFNPSTFCLPFYRSFHTIIFKKQEEARKEVDKYLSETKCEVGYSKNKELLFKTVENLANALKEVQDLENMDLKTRKNELDFYRKYCNQAAELMRDTEKTAPSATILIRKGPYHLRSKAKIPPRRNPGESKDRVPGISRY